jgi:hypothetical protein
MDKTKKPISPQGEKIYDDILPVISATECAGLLPTPPETDGDINSYTDIYDIPLAKEDKV